MLNVIKFEENFIRGDIFLRNKSNILSKDDVINNSFNNLIMELFNTLYSDPSVVGLAARKLE